MNTKDLTIVIVSFKSEGKILNCLRSINNKAKVIIVENSDNKKFKSDVEISFPNSHCILAGENKGYAIANNIGLNQVKTKYALVLNPDTILDSKAIENFLISAKENKEFWLIGPANDQFSNVKFKNNLAEVNNLKGFAIFLNLSKFENKYFDENFFLYFEEIDLCKRVKKNNGKIYLDQRIKISHQGSSSVENLNKFELEKNRNWHWMWSSFYFHKKYKGLIFALIITSPKLFSAFIKTIFYSVFFQKEKREIYFCRLSGIFNSVIGNKSWYRPSLD